MGVTRFCGAAFVGVIFLASGTMAEPGSALTVLATYKGKISGSYDKSGLFGGVPGGSLDGLRFELRFIYDPSIAGADRIRDGDIGSDVISGDQASGGTGSTTDPVLSAMLRIGSHTETLLGNSGFVQSTFVDDPTGDYSQIWHQQYDYTETTDSSGNLLESFDSFVQIGVDNEIADNPFPSDLETPLALTHVDNFNTLTGYLDPGDHYFQFSHQTYDGSGQANAPDILTYGDFAVTSVQISPVPLPGALPLMLSGLGGLGFLAWRRRKGVAA